MSVYNYLKTVLKAVLILCSLFILTAWNMKGQKLQGKFYGDRYYDPQGCFSISVRPWERHAIQEINEESTVGAVFHDDSGALKRVEAAYFPKETFAEITNEIGLEAFHKTVFDQSVMASFKAKHPGIKKIAEEFIETGTDKQVSYFTVFHIPEGSTVVNAATGERPDAKMGFLVRTDGNRLVVFGNQLDPFAAKVLSLMDDGDCKIKESLMRSLVGMVSEYRNECINCGGKL